MKITGELLKTERLKTSLSVSEVAQSLKLSSKIITAIEAGDLNSLPAKTFIRGFVKSYAQLLKIDDTFILRQFQEEMGSTQPLPKTPPPSSSVDMQNQTVATKKEKVKPTTVGVFSENRNRNFIYVFASGLLLVFIVVINSFVSKYKEEAVVDANNLKNVTPIQSGSVPIENTSSVTAAAPTEATNIVSSLPVTTTTEKADSKEIKIENSFVPQNLADFEPSAGKPVELIVEAKKDTEFFYSKGNTQNFVRVQLAAKEIQIIRSPSGLHLKSEDGSLLSLTLNGVVKGSAASTNKSVKLTF